MQTTAAARKFEPVEPHLRLVPPPRALHAVEGTPREHRVPQAPPTSVASGDCPPLEHRVIGRIAATAYEIAEGSRQVANLSRWITPAVAKQLAHVRALNIERRSLYRDTRRSVPTVRRVRAVSTSEGVIEATVVLNTPGRARATAMRFEYARGAWRASYLAVI